MEKIMSSGQTSEYFRDYYQKNKEKIIRRTETRRLKVQYNLTPEEHNLLLMSNSCDICGKGETRKHKGKVKRLCIDHDHVTGKVRGVLCHDCNTGIGLLRDSIELIEKARDYLGKT
jgi:hypothetical protein